MNSWLLIIWLGTTPLGNTPQGTEPIAVMTFESNTTCKEERLVQIKGTSARALSNCIPALLDSSEVIRAEKTWMRVCASCPRPPMK